MCPFYSVQFDDFFPEIAHIFLFNWVPNIHFYVKLHLLNLHYKFFSRILGGKKSHNKAANADHYPQAAVPILGKEQQQLSQM